MTDYRVQLDVFTGPLDLLLYLIKRDELDVQDIPIARVTENTSSTSTCSNRLTPTPPAIFWSWRQRSLS